MLVLSGGFSLMGFFWRWFIWLCCSRLLLYGLFYVGILAIVTSVWSSSDGGWVGGVVGW